jgi:putative spermidine/putrescine transport system ATP-binding protein
MIPFLDIAKLRIAYGETRVVDELDLGVAKGEFVGLLGPSGCGKTTTLKAIAGLIEPAGGSITVGGAPLQGQPVHRRNIGFVFQNYALFPHLDALANVRFGLDMRSVSRRDAEARARKALELVRLGHLADRRPRQLSGGQQQRLALARALVIEPRLLLLDECLSNLDAKLRESLRKEIRDIQQQLGITTLFVTHDQSEALTMCDRIAILDRGRILQIGTPLEIYDRPADAFVARFVGRINEIEVLGEGGIFARAGETRIELPSPQAPDAKLTLMVRPHRIAIGEAGAPMRAGDTMLPAKIKRKTFLGDQIEIDLESPVGQLTLQRSAADGAWRQGELDEAVTLHWRVADSFVFPSEVSR